MQFSDDTPTVRRTIQEMQFDIPQPFEEGHTCSANEAAALNQLLVENTRNNFASTVKEAKEKAEKEGKEVDPVALQDELTGYVKGYDFFVRGGGGPSLDPVDAIAIKLATDWLKGKLKGQGHKLKDFAGDKMRELAREAIEKNPKFLEKAKVIYEVQTSAADELESSAA